ncbi:putative uncharacterized protein BRD3OS isoform X1 [Myotis daubentonii]|uniref:putative uncharacterized protein BRD3OS isoform X1 n=1 Tax=Myotis daubentonii TaxID=98922 RepID=UPI002873DE71|nr:putative uncharacterized protein BRD3OS isoform X1 [Myotis daubentonii]
MAPAHRAGLPALGARLGMPAVLPWRRGRAAQWHSLGQRLARARASRRPHGAGASGCLEQKEGAGAGRVPGGPQPAAQGHLGEAPPTSLTRSTAWTLAPHPEAPRSPQCAEPPRLPWGQAAMGAAMDFCLAAQCPSSGFLFPS